MKTCDNCAWSNLCGGGGVCGRWEPTITADEARIRYEESKADEERGK